MIEQLIQQVVAKLGIDEGLAQKAVGTVLGLLKKQGDGGAVSALFDKIPGAADLAGKFSDAPAASGGGLMGGLMGKLGGAIGGNAGGAMEAMNALKDTGLSMDQAKDMAPVVTGFLKEKAGGDLLGKALESVPALKSLLG